MIPFKTKIVATLGPSSSNEQVIKTLMREGARIFRLNFSHGQHDTHLANIEFIRSISEKEGIATTIIADLCGPKIRVGSFLDGKIQLQKAIPSHWIQIHAWAQQTLFTRNTRCLRKKSLLVPAFYSMMGY